MKATDAQQGKPQMIDPPAGRRRRRQPTLAAVRRKCLECLNRDRIGFDCELEDCPLYQWQPWKGRPWPQR